MKCSCSLVHNTSPDLLGLYLFRCSVLAVYQENTIAGPAEVRNTEYRELCVALTAVLLSALFLESIATGKCVRKLYHLNTVWHSELTLHRDQFTFLTFNSNIVKFFWPSEITPQVKTANFTNFFLSPANFSYGDESLMWMCLACSPLPTRYKPPQS